MYNLLARNSLIAERVANLFIAETMRRIQGLPCKLRGWIIKRLQIFFNVPSYISRRFPVTSCLVIRERARRVSFYASDYQSALAEI